jgi:hypothetical protein
MLRDAAPGIGIRIMRHFDKEPASRDEIEV